MNITDSNLKVVPLHQHPEYITQCCHLLNDEWKRSETARLHSLKSSSERMPTCLILLKDKELIGHCKLSVIPSIREACFIESVVIDRKLRGKGYGSYLMKKAEEYCKNVIHLNSVYLSTKGQEGFYSKLGYERCEPVSIYGSFTQNGLKRCNETKTGKLVNAKPEVPENKREPLHILGPPPPPLPCVNNNSNHKIYMRKDLL